MKLCMFLLFGVDDSLENRIRICPRLHHPHPEFGSISDQSVSWLWMNRFTISVAYLKIGDGLMLIGGLEHEFFFSIYWE